MCLYKTVVLFNIERFLNYLKAEVFLFFIEYRYKVKSVLQTSLIKKNIFDGFYTKDV